MYSRKKAQKLLAAIRGDTDNGVFLIEKCTGNTWNGWTDTVPYLWGWFDVVEGYLSPATYKDYRKSIKNHFEPFFRKNPFQLHYIEYDMLRKILKSIKREGKRYTSSIMIKIWKNACLEVGKLISMYDGLKHSSCSQYANEKELSLSDLQTITGHA